MERQTYIKRRKRRKRKIILRRFIIFLMFVFMIVSGTMLFKSFLSGRTEKKSREEAKNRITELKNAELPEYVDPQIIHIHNTARTGTKLTDIKNIVIHYVGNPNTTAQNNRDYYDKADTEVSSHFVIGLNGEVIQCVPLDEKSAASNNRNKDTISIEVCHPDKTGKFNDQTYDSLIKLTSWLLDKTGLDENDVIRHYDITGKLCPLYYVSNESAWDMLKADIKENLSKK